VFNDFTVIVTIVYFLIVGQHKFEFIPDIIGPILEMTLIPETGMFCFEFVYV